MIRKCLVCSSQLIGLLLCVLIAPVIVTAASRQHAPTKIIGMPIIVRGGASVSEVDDTTRFTRYETEPYELLAAFVRNKFEDVSESELTKTLGRLASSQQTLKGLDGAAHEAYQRTHAGDDIDTTVSGRAQRSAARLAAAAEALLACELVEMIENPNLDVSETIAGRQVLLNITFDDDTVKLGNSNVAVLLLYEESYDGGSGLEHGTIVSLATLSKSASSRKPQKPKGRLLIVLGDALSDDFQSTLEILNQKPQRVKISSGLVTNELASVQPTLYATAATLLTVLEPLLRKYNATAVHFVGRSMAGGVASLAATILDGTIPMPKSKKGGKKSKKSKSQVSSDGEREQAVDGNNTTQVPELIPLSGLGRARSSAISLGAPPCLSSNVLAAFCTSIIHGDDVICRTTQETVDRLLGRIQRSLSGGFVGRNIGWVSDTISLTVSSLKSHAHGSEGEELKLSVPGRGYLVRPRRLGGICSIHEVGNLNKGGREALRANLFWQLNDVLLSKSMWKHHKLESYIQALDRVQLRGSTDEETSLY